ncbi:pseudouridine synthase [Nonlabens xiamenensis]|uniref:pseudouridine synthase n=1 Tax=Nonlabens xiamenensis TaxID=2341043 RepID=UPI000F60A84C|nr:pseudouridine synthase [Nonlabens xiamenensis]
MEHRHYLLYKPYRMLSQFMTNSKRQKKKRFLGELYSFPEDVMSVGRLDEKTEGLLIVTTDGQLSYKINTSAEFDKEYYAQVDGMIDQRAIEELTRGVKISIEGKSYSTKSCKAFVLQTPPELPPTQQYIRDDRHGPTSWISITLTEGKFRQVRKMCAVVGFPVLRLARIRIGPFGISDLKGQQVMEITEEFER